LEFTPCIHSNTKIQKNILLCIFFCFTVLNFLLHGKHFRASTLVETCPRQRVTIDELVYMNEQVPKEVTIVDKSVSERINLIQQLEQEDKQALFRIIDSMLTKTKFKDFFDKNMASL